jgi:ATP synthase protein I
MPKPDEPRDEALKRLDQRLDAFTAGREPKNAYQGARSASDGYRLLAELIGGILGGLGFGWVFDQVVHTSPLGMICGLLIGLGVSIWVIVRQAGVMAAKASKEAGPVHSVPFDDDDEN